MSDALVLALPGAPSVRYSGAVMAWDLSWPTSTPPRMRARAAAGALAVCAGSCLAAALWDTAATRATGLLAAVCLLAVLAALSRGRRRGRRGRRRQAAVPAQRTHLHVLVPVPAAPAATTDRTKEPA